MTNPSSGDPYTTLGVGRDATAADIRHAYRALVRAHHPDLGNPSPVPGANDDGLEQIYLAYAILRDPRRRAQYDSQHPRRVTRSDRQANPASPSVRQPRSAPPIQFGPVHWQPR